MAQRDNDNGNGRRVKFVDPPINEFVKEPLPEKILESIPEIVKMRLLKDVILKYTGPVTGNMYIFNRGGAVVDVDKRDAEIMINKRSNIPCCSGGTQSPYFEFA